MHIESDFSLVKALINIMNKFHVIKHDYMPTEIDQFAKDNKSKVVLFRSADAYATKIIASLSGNS